MKPTLLTLLCGLLLLVPVARGLAQEAADAEEVTDDVAEAAEEGERVAEDAAEEVEQAAEDPVDDAGETVKDIARRVDEDERAKEATAGILEPIYLLAEAFSFSAFHWIAFAVMVTGVVSFALQLVLGKLVAMFKMGLTLMEVLTDALGLVISLIGLVLTTQAAAQNSTFTDHPASVLSATAVGIVFGFVFYRWGQSQELQAIRGRRLDRPRKD